MRKVILKRLRFSNYRAQSVDFTFAESGNTVIGQNKSGKTKLFSAFMWCMTGADEKDRSNFQLFDNRKELTYENAVPASVDIWLDIDGDEYKISRTAEQSWTRPRGKSEYVKAPSDKYKMFIDGIEMSAKDFNARIEQLFCPVNVLKVILNIRHIFTLDWKEQRQLFSLICGDIKENDFKPEFGVLFDEMKKYSIQEIESQIKAKMKPIKDSMDSLPDVIRTLESNLPDISQAKQAEAEINKISEEMFQIDKVLADQSKKSEPIFEERDRIIAEIEKKKQEIYDAGRKYEINSHAVEISNKIDEAEISNYRILGHNKRNAEKKEYLLDKINQIETSIMRNEEKLVRLRKERDDLKAQEFERTTCKYCGQALSEEKQEELRALFYSQKEEELDYIVAEGKALAAENKVLKGRIEEYKKQYDEIPADEPLIELESLREEYQVALKNVIPFSETDEYKRIKEEIRKLGDSLPEIPKFDTEEYTNKKKELSLGLQNCYKVIGLLDEHKKQELKIQEYKEQLRDTGNELAKLEKKEALVKAYQQEYANLVSDKVNRLLEICKVQMMQQGKNGEWSPSCIITTDSIQFSVYNRAEVARSGLDISNAFMKFYGLNMPLFLDDAESITSNTEIKTDRQIIRLVAKDDQIELKVV